MKVFIVVIKSCHINQWPSTAVDGHQIMYTVWAHQSSCVSNVFEAIWRKFHMHFIIGGLFIGWTLLEMEDAVTEARLCMDSPYVMKQSIPLSISTWFLKYRVSLYFFSISNSKKKYILKQTRFFVEFELDFYCLCSLQKSISKSNWFFDFLNLIFQNWKKIEWHSILQKSSGDRQGDWCLK